MFLIIKHFSFNIVIKFVVVIIIEQVVRSKIIKKINFFIKNKCKIKFIKK
jgi:hypothetical protein